MKIAEEFCTTIVLHEEQTYTRIQGKHIGINWFLGRVKKTGDTLLGKDMAISDGTLIIELEMNYSRCKNEDKEN